VSLRALVAAVVLAAGVTACEGRDTPEPPSRPLADIGGCIQPDEASLEIYDDGTVSAAVAIFGAGRAGVVVSHEENVSVCNWLRAAEQLGRAGYSVLLYDRLHGSEGAVVPAMAGLMRQRGVRRLAVVGGSGGGVVSLGEAVFMSPPPEAVVSVSGADESTTRIVGRLRTPLLQIVAEDDPTMRAAAATHAAAGPIEHRLVVLPGKAHASMLFPVHARALRVVERFLRRVMPPERIAGAGGGTRTLTPEGTAT